MTWYFTILRLYLPYEVRRNPHTRRGAADIEQESKTELKSSLGKKSSYNFYR